MVVRIASLFLFLSVSASPDNGLGYWKNWEDLVYFPYTHPLWLLFLASDLCFCLCLGLPTVLSSLNLDTTPYLAHLYFQGDEWFTVTVHYKFPSHLTIWPASAEGTVTECFSFAPSLLPHIIPRPPAGGGEQTLLARVLGFLEKWKAGWVLVLSPASSWIKALHGVF